MVCFYEIQTQPISLNYIIEADKFFVSFQIRIKAENKTKEILSGG